MPYQIIDEESGLLFRWSGDVTFKEIDVANRKGWERPGWNKHQYQIWDFENVETFDIDERDFLTIASMDNVHTRLTKLIKVAFVTDNEHIKKKLEVYMGDVESKKLETRIFADKADARKWVSV